MAQSNRGRKDHGSGRSSAGGARGGNGRAGRNDAQDYLELIDERPSRAGKQASKEPTARGSKRRSNRTGSGTMLSRTFRWALRIALLFFGISIAMVILYRFIDPPLTPLMLIRPLEALGDGHATGIDKKWTPIEQISPLLLRSVIASEDSRFFNHNGVDWDAVEKAEKRNERSKGRKIFGASTITMQCARNVFLWQGRNYLRKGLEVYFTYLMEAAWSKRRILEVYLNVIEWGDGVYGVDAAAHKYFGTSASRLSARQAALLVAVLPNPRHYNAGHPDGYINGRAATIMARAPLVELDELGSLRSAPVERPSREP